MSDNKKYKKYNSIKNIRLAQLAISLGLNFALWSFVGYFLGSRIDAKLGTAPWFMLIGILLGISFTFYGFIKEILVYGEIEKKLDKDDKKE
jgi:F0F1-type ATP synthase assembly protein I